MARNEIEQEALKQRAVELAQARNRKGEREFTDRALLRRLKRIRDGSLIWMEQCVLTASTKGSGAAVNLFERATEAIDRLELRLGKVRESKLELTWAPFEPDPDRVEDLEA